MVSIPDWAKFSRSVDSGQKQDSYALLDKYYKQQEQVAIRQAEQAGYFLEPTKDYLLKHVGPLSGTRKELTKIFLCNLEGLHLRSLGDIPQCSSLQICVLANNFLSKIDALSSCQQLVKLDLHGNQLTSVPGPSFWSALRKLRALHLHDNPLGMFETLQSLSASPVLAILTLYDTPLYLKKNYRHHVVNSIWSLKALDHHVIADEEIIEDALFGSHFSALSQHFKLELCPPSSSNTSYRQEVRNFHSLEAQINKILAKHSPVIIIQSFLRGYFTRKRLGLVPARTKQMGEQRKRDVLVMPPVGPSLRRVIGTESGLVPPPSPISQLVMDQIPRELLLLEPGRAGAGIAPRSNIYINMAKLQMGLLRTLQAEEEIMDSIYCRMSDSSGEVEALNLSELKKRKKEEKEVKARFQRIKSIKQFFGPIVKTKPEDEGGEGERGGLEDEDELPITQYRLRGKQPTLILTDATTDMILSRMEAGRHVREAEAERVARASREPAPVVAPYNFMTNDMRLFSRVQGTMGLSCLFSVQKAYRNREKAEKATAKMECILAMREERQRAKERIHLYHEEKRNQAMRKRDQDQARILDQMEKRELMRLNYLDKRQELKGRSSELTKTLQADNTFMTEFRTNHTSVSKALFRHDNMTLVHDKMTSKKEKVQSLRDTELEQQELVKRYLQHRQLIRQNETAMARAALDTRMLQETTERLMEAQQRVAHTKAKEATVQAFYPLPPSNIPSAVVTRSAGFSRLEAGVRSQQDRPA